MSYLAAHRATTRDLINQIRTLELPKDACYDTGELVDVKLKTKSYASPYDRFATTHSSQAHVSVSGAAERGRAAAEIYRALEENLQKLLELRRLGEGDNGAGVPVA